MAIEITLPKLTDTMEEATVVQWLKQVGEAVQAGEIIAEVETDKANMELESAASGILAEIRVAEGETARVGAVLALVDATARSATAAPPTPPRPAVESARPAPAKAPRPAKPTPPPPPQPVAASAPAAGRVELSKMRLTIARRMAEAKRDVPHFYVTREIEMDEAMRLRAALEATGRIEGPLTVTHVLIKAVAVALQRCPRLNASWDDGALRFSEHVNVGIATAVEDGLLVPVIIGCEHLGLPAIAAAARQLGEKARGGRFSADEMLGGTFTISNLGMLEVDEFAAVINPPQVAILAVGTVRARAVVRAGQLAAAQTMRVTLSCDHRALNGVEAAQFLAELKQLLENPLVLAIG
ncbi:MAG: 2-oxo acid dehydrogenase subunit E2 [Deltaproteobacteria bacterium]|nr:2-oxo acid dehydrogenase subunit E2 [Deltaproteobacteria bacterium]